MRMDVNDVYLGHQLLKLWTRKTFGKYISCLFCRAHKHGKDDAFINLLFDKVLADLHMFS